MIAIMERIFGTGRRARMRLASALITLGVLIHIALADLGFCIEPDLFGPRDLRRPTPWLGLAVLGLLIIGAATVGYAGLVVIREAVPQREVAP